jgi:ATP-binding protein involved in chromosome partitioning
LKLLDMSDEFILSLLGKVKYPGFSRDIVSFGMVREALLDETGKATVKLELSGNDPTLPQSLKGEVEQTLLGEERIHEVDVQVVVKLSKGQQPGSSSGPEPAGPKRTIKKIVAIASGKGGVGKSTLAVNLACAFNDILSAQGKVGKVGLMDCDVYGPSVPLLIGASERPRGVSENMIEPIESYGVKVMSMGLLVDDETPIVWRGPMVMKTIQQFADNVEWGELDLLLIDLPPGTGDVQLSLAQILPLDGAVLVTTPQKAAVDVARRGARMFEKVNIPILGVVENMSYLEDESGKKNYLFGQGGGGETAKALNTGFLGKIPLHQEVREGGDHGTPVVIANPENPASIAISKIAQSLSEILPV